jgi:DNA-binding transcriptional ArsR family regulator
MSSGTLGPAPTPATLAQVRALADPLRYRVFESLLTQPRTAKQMAEHLGTHPTRLYHHFRVLKKAGLIRPAGTRQKRGTTEKYFTAIVDRIDATGANLPSPVTAALVEGALSSTLADIATAGRASRASRPATFVKRYRFRATPAQAARLQARLEAIAAMCEAMSAPGNAQEFGLTLAFYQAPAFSKAGGRKRS